MRIYFQLVCLSLLATFPLALGGGRSQSNSAQEKGTPKEEGKVTIPLSEIYSTTGQQGLKERIYGGTDPGQAFELRSIQKEGCSGGATNILMARGDNIAQAISSTRSMLVAGLPADRPAPPLNKNSQEIKSDKFWLVVYLGRSSSTLQALVQSVAVEAKTIKFSFSRPMPALGNADSIEYFYWVPLAELKSGRYELNLIDADSGERSLTRWVKIP